MKRIFKPQLSILFVLLFGCQALNSSKPIYENNMIRIDGYSDDKDLTAFIDIINTNARGVIMKYNPAFNRQVNIRLYPSLSALHSAQGRPNAPDWFVGSVTRDGNIEMLYPYNSAIHDYQAMTKILLHEYTHVITKSVNKNIPSWLFEGIAIFEADQYNSIRRRKALKIEAENNTLPMFNTIDLTPSSGMAYRYAGSIVEYIIAEYSIDKLNQFIRNPNITEVFNKTEIEFQDGWKNYILSMP